MKQLMLVVLFFACAGLLSAQDTDKVSALAAKTQALEATYSVGGGSYFSDEATTFTGDALFFAAQWHGFDEFPGVPAALDVSTGAMAEIGKSSLTASVDDIHVRIWSTERLRIGNVITGTDMKIVDSSDFDFDLRVVTGYAFSKQASIEIYFLEDQRPVAWALFYRF